eukprot:2661917-Rhodomonas_salina.2
MEVPYHTGSTAQRVPYAMVVPHKEYHTLSQYRTKSTIRYRSTAQRVPYAIAVPHKEYHTLSQYGTNSTILVVPQKEYHTLWQYRTWARPSSTILVSVPPCLSWPSGTPIRSVSTAHRVVPYARQVPDRG